MVNGWFDVITECGYIIENRVQACVRAIQRGGRKWGRFEGGGVVPMILELGELNLPRCPSLFGTRNKCVYVREMWEALPDREHRDWRCWHISVASRPRGNEESAIRMEPDDTEGTYKDVEKLYCRRGCYLNCKRDGEWGGPYVSFDVNAKAYQEEE